MVGATFGRAQEAIKAVDEVQAAIVPLVFVAVVESL